MDIPELLAIQQDITTSDERKFQLTLELWYNKQNAMALLKQEEMELRKMIFERCFQTPVEGSGNKYDLQGGWIVQGTYKIDRKVDEATFLANKAKFEKAKIPVDMVVKWKPELSVSAYKALTPDQRKLLDVCVSSKPGSPALEVKLPQRR